MLSKQSTTEVYPLALKSLISFERLRGQFKNQILLFCMYPFSSATFSEGTFYSQLCSWQPCLKLVQHHWPPGKGRSKPLLGSMPHWLSSRSQITSNGGKDVEKGEPLFIIGGSLNSCSH